MLTRFSQAVDLILRSHVFFLLWHIVELFLNYNARLKYVECNILKYDRQPFIASNVVGLVCFLACILQWFIKGYTDAKNMIFFIRFF